MQNKEYRENISSEEIAEFELDWFRGEMILVDSIEIFNRVIPRLEGQKVLGFDTETKPSFKKGRKNAVSLIQLSTSDLACLFRINKIGIPAPLIRILSDKNIIKAGVAVHDDIRFLSGVKSFNPAGFVDLQHYVKGFGIESSGLKKLAAIVLGIRISKRQQVTDWEAEVLSEAQLVYAATDAWVCHEIYTRLSHPSPRIKSGDREAGTVRW
ncbi:MAG: 3'-5' exonuclease domain-containing protein 2 [Bacteroidales bacterium]|nr:3'-5' exonuclease domain-containing protein 2 [Bacteroidales bacterium]